MRLKTTHERRLGATDAAPLLGLGKWANARDVFERVVNGVKTPRNAAMERGIRAEPHIRARYVAETGAELMQWVGRPVILEHRAHHWATYSPDDIEVRDGEPWRVVEYKSASRWARGWDDGPPADYVLQCQWAMWVAGLPLAALYVAFGVESPAGEWLITNDGLWLFQADVELQATFADVGGRFWREHVETRTPPAMEPMAKSKRNKRNTNQGEQTP